MAVSKEYMEHIAGLLAPLARRAEDVRVRRMFGGAGVYYQRLMFGLIANETLYFKVNDATKARHKAHGCGPFVFQPAGKKPIAMSYWQVPDHVMEDEDELLRWARAAVDAAQKRPSRTASKSPARASKPSQAELEKTLKEHAPWLI